MGSHLRCKPRLARAGLFVCVVAALSTGRLAAADTTPQEQALATTLFKEAKALFEVGRIPEACRKFEESQRIYPAGGTLLNLAVCHEKEGRTASAWAEFREARLTAERDGRADRVALAETHRNALEPKLSKLVIHVAPAADVPGIDVTADGHAMKRAAWDVAMPVDPGDHTVEATAPGMKPWHQQVTVLSHADVQSVTVPAWEIEATASEPTPAPVPTVVTSAPPVHVEQAPPVHVERAPPVSPAPNRTAALIAGTLGLGGIAIGSYFGVFAITKHGQSNRSCTTNPCSPASVALNDSAKTAADVSTVAFVVGLAGLGLGVFLWLSNTHAPTPHTPQALVFGLGTLDLRGTF